MRIDAHQHFWRYAPELYGWMTEEMRVIRRDFLPADLGHHLAEHDIDASVCVQARQDVQETRWLLELASANPFIAGVVGWVDLRSPDVESQLDEFCAHPAFKGVRHVVHDEPDDEFLLGDDFCRGIATLAARGLTYDLLIYPKHLDAACRFVDRFPEQPFVLDHVGKPPIAEGGLEPWATGIHELARREHVTCKVSGMVTEAHWTDWLRDDYMQYLEVIFETFGTQRLMFGSDWPVCLLSSEYRPMKEIVDTFAERLSADEREALYGGTAARFYGIDSGA